MQILRGRTTVIDTLAVSPNSRFVLACGRGLGCPIWDLWDAKPKPRILQPNDAAFFRLGFPSPMCLVIHCRKGWWRHDLAAGTQVEIVLPPPVESFSALYYPPGDFFKACDKSEKRAFTVRVTAEGVVFSAGNKLSCDFGLHTFDPAGRRCLVFDLFRSFSEHVYHLTDTATDAIVTTFHESPAVRGGHTLKWAFSPDGLRLYAMGWQYVAAYDCQEGGPPIVEICGTKPRQFDALAVHPGGRVLATIEYPDTVTLRDADTLQPLCSYDFAMPKLTCVAFTPDGTRCVVGNSRGKVLLFDVE